MRWSSEHARCVTAVRVVVPCARGEGSRGRKRSRRRPRSSPPRTRRRPRPGAASSSTASSSSATSIVAGLKAHGDAAMRLHPPEAGDRVLDIGCGFGDTTQQLAALVGAEGHAIGVDVSEPFIEASIEEAREGGRRERRLLRRRRPGRRPEGPYDYAFSRMGVMFFANPVQALRNIRGALRPGGRLVRRRLAAQARQRVASPCRAGGRAVPRGARGAGGRALRTRARSRWRTPTQSPSSCRSQDSSVPPSLVAIYRSRSATTSIRRSRFNMAIGPAAELLRICPADEVERLRPKVQQEIREVLADYVEADGVGPRPRPPPGSSARPFPSSRRRIPFRPWQRHFPRRESPRASPRSGGSSSCSRITFDPDALRREVDRLEGEMQSPGFWDDQAAAAEISARHARAQRRLEGFRKLSDRRRRSRGATPSSPPRTRRWPASCRPARLGGAAARRARGGAALLRPVSTPGTPWSRSTPARAAPTPRTGPRCCSACTCAGPSAAASRSR